MAVSRRQAAFGVLGMAALSSYGLARAKIDGRRADPRAVGKVGESLAGLPLRFGDWTGADEKFDDPGQLRRAGAAAYLFRRYRKPGNPREVAVLAMAGQPKHLSLHAPDVCYTAGGEHHLADDRRSEIPLAGGTAMHGRFTPTVGQGDGVVVLWSYFDGAGWSAPAVPRLSFLSAPYLIKLYVIVQAAPEMPTEPPTELAEALARGLADAARAVAIRESAADPGGSISC